MLFLQIKKTQICPKNNQILNLFFLQVAFRSLFCIYRRSRHTKSTPSTCKHSVAARARDTAQHHRAFPPPRALPRPSLPPVSLLGGEVGPRAGSLRFLRGSAGREAGGGRFDCRARAGEAPRWETGINNAAPQEGATSVWVNPQLDGPDCPSADGSLKALYINSFMAKDLSPDSNCSVSSCSFAAFPNSSVAQI